MLVIVLSNLMRFFTKKSFYHQGGGPLNEKNTLIPNFIYIFRIIIPKFIYKFGIRQNFTYFCIVTLKRK